MSLDVVDALATTTDGARRTGPDQLAVRCGPDDAVLVVDPPRSQAMDVVPYLRLLAPLPALDGFELDLAPRRRRFDAHEVARGEFRVVGPDDEPLAVDQARLLLGERDLHVRANDRALAATWLDPPVRAAIVDALQVALQWGVLRGVRGVVRGPRIRIDHDRLEVELEGGVSLAHLPSLARAAAALATLPRRIARAWSTTAEALGGHVPATGWDLVRPALTVARGGVTVTLDNVRAPGADAAGDRQLRTRAHARLPSSAAPWQLLRLGKAPGRALLGDYVTRADQVDTLRRVLGPVAGHLAASQPDRVVTGGGVLTIVWDGLVTDPARLGPALDLVRAIVVGAATDAGPYR